MSEIVYPFGGGLYVNITNRCDNACDFCLRRNAEGIGDARLWLDREPTADEVIAALEEADFTDYTEIVFCGYGEPTERIEVLTAAAREAKAHGVRTRLNTNGHGSLTAGKDIVGELVGVIDAVSVSLNAPTAQEYQSVCHSRFGEKSFEAMLVFAVGCKSAGIETCFSVVDVIGEDKIAECRALSDGYGIPLKVRAYIEHGEDERSTRLK